MQADPGAAPGLEAQTNSNAQLFLTPNQITSIRIVISIFVFFALEWNYYTSALVLFILAASTDWIDGYLARKHHLVSPLGRVLDPIADKIIICGTFIYLSAKTGSQIGTWMSVVVVSRELAVTVVRSFLEQQGKDFSAAMAGKLKMVFQCVAAAASILLLRQIAAERVPEGLQTLVIIFAWLAVLSTIYSGVVYIFPAKRLFQEIK